MIVCRNIQLEFRIFKAGSDSVTFPQNYSKRMFKTNRRRSFINIEDTGSGMEDLRFIDVTNFSNPALVSGEKLHNILHETFEGSTFEPESWG